MDGSSWERKGASRAAWERRASSDCLSRQWRCKTSSGLLDKPWMCATSTSTESIAVLCPSPIADPPIETESHETRNERQPKSRSVDGFSSSPAASSNTNVVVGQRKGRFNGPSPLNRQLINGIINKVVKKLRVFIYNNIS